MSTGGYTLQIFTSTRTPFLCQNKFLKTLFLDAYMHDIIFVYKKNMMHTYPYFVNYHQ